MRLGYCYRCKTLSQLADYEGPPEYDGLLQDWIDRHMHGLTEDEHPGGRIFVLDVSGDGIDRHVQDRHGEDYVLSALEMAAVQEVRSDLQRVNQEVFDLRDELRIDAVQCHLKHGQPSWPGKPCIDYHAGSKLLGRKNAPKELRQFLCTYCPYESSVTVDKRARRGDYKANR